MVTVPPVIGCPFISNTRIVIVAGLVLRDVLWMVPDTAARLAYCGRAPKAVKATQVVPPFRQAFEVTVWPWLSAPTTSVAAATPVELVVDAVADATTPVTFCHFTCCPAIGAPPLCASACT